MQHKKISKVMSADPARNIVRAADRDAQPEHTAEPARDESCPQPAGTGLGHEREAILLEYLEQIFNASRDGICISDADGIVVHLNKRHAEITGIPRNEMLGHSVMEFVNRGTLDVVLNPEIMRTGQPATSVQTVSDGRKLILEGFPVYDREGKVVLCMTFIRDITMLSAMREQLDAQKELLTTFQQLTTNEDQIISLKIPKIFTSKAMVSLYGEVDRVAQTDATVLLLGETGVGKDVIARRIHAASPRKDKSFIKVDCGSIPENLIETELFGYAAGTFSGANRQGKVGLIEAASGGTLFLDEIGELPMSMQTRLLRVLQDFEIMRVGSTVPKPVNVRVVAATNKNLEQAIANGEFRSDLYYRLKVAVLTIPPLRERKADILPLARMFLSFYGRKYSRQLTFSEEAEKLLLRHRWPGNVRELENLIQGLLVICKGSVIQPQDLPFGAAPAPKTLPARQVGQELSLEGRTFKEIMKEYENRVLVAAMERWGNIGDVARHFQVDRSTIFRKVRELERQGLIKTKQKS